MSFTLWVTFDRKDVMDCCWAAVRGEVKGLLATLVLAAGMTADFALVVGVDFPLAIGVAGFLAFLAADSSSVINIEDSAIRPAYPENKEASFS